jgi:hypothetical protein
VPDPAALALAGQRGKAVRRVGRRTVRAVLVTAARSRQETGAKRATAVVPKWAAVVEVTPALEGAPTVPGLTAAVTAALLATRP